MSTESIENRVRAVIAKQLRVADPAIPLEKSFIDDLGADSLDIAQLVMALEDEFGFEIPDQDAESIRTVGDAVQYIASHQSHA